jgi:hypothetical protein
MWSHYRPSEQARNDYYDVVPRIDDQWGFVMADVAGHGTQAAVIMTVMRTLIHAGLPSNRDKSAGEFLESGPSPARVVRLPRTSCMPVACHFQPKPLPSKASAFRKGDLI